MSDQPETVNMSLDDVIKQNRAKVLASKKAVAKPKAKKVAAKKAVVAKKTSASKKGKGAAARAPPVDNLTLQTAIKIAKAVGYSKASRADAMNKKRGLNSSVAPKDKATKASVQAKIRQQVNKQVAKKFSGATKAAGARGKSQRAATANNMGQGKLKISFNPGSLKSTTDKTVSAQIFGAMSRGKGFGGSAPNNQNNKKATKQNVVKGKGGSSVIVVKR